MDLVLEAVLASVALLTACAGMVWFANLAHAVRVEEEDAEPTTKHR